jgi:hypothetical protein
LIFTNLLFLLFLCIMECVTSGTAIECPIVFRILVLAGKRWLSE